MCVTLLIIIYLLSIFVFQTIINFRTTACEPIQYLHHVVKLIKNAIETTFNSTFFSIYFYNRKYIYFPSIYRVVLFLSLS